MAELFHEPHSMTNDLDAAHARLRAHQSNLDYINSRIDSSERRVDRLEKRMDDQSQVLADTKVATMNIQNQMENQTVMLERSSIKQIQLIDRIDDHIRQEIEQENLRTRQVERLHRTIIRASTLFAILAIALIALTDQNGLFSIIVKFLGG